ncbi:N-acetylmuramoyl-L-alanine amidase [Ambystoma mexicanum]|uniref:N-acetylmuramoyl-L-alanine amidase n=1 Tax=Ambystoma mexicanum TaxID=8296 RepID=UPI0037E807AC
MASVVAAAALLCSLLCCPGLRAEASDASHAFSMKNVIQVIEDLEVKHPGASARQLIDQLRKKASESSQEPGNRQSIKEADVQLISYIMTYDFKAQIEYGVVLAPDGTTVAFAPLLAGIETGLKKREEMTVSSQNKGPVPGGQGAEKIHHPEQLLSSPKEVEVAVGTEEVLSMKSPTSLSKRSQELLVNADPLDASMLTHVLAIAYLQFHLHESNAPIGPDGCWDSVSQPQIFTLAGPPSGLTNSFLNGALDGFILGNDIVQDKASAVKLSLLLKKYYISPGAAAESAIESSFRRQRFLATSDIGRLEEQVKNVLLMYKEAEGQILGRGPEDSHLILSIARKAAETFHQYLACPAIIPRCMWEAKPYRGTPTLLNTPLAYVYIHHTYEPGQPCRTFGECAADMRSMQRFHQEDRGWDDIGYNFVAGADGYLYEGRGWTWQGAHTKGYNSKGYGVSFIGDYTSQLPPDHALTLVKDNFLQCAVSGGYLIPGYTIHGHRQMGQTTCPGDALFSKIQTWSGFKEV